jgi:hypothetical protein
MNDLYKVFYQAPYVAAIPPGFLVGLALELLPGRYESNNHLRPLVNFSGTALSACVPSLFVKDYSWIDANMFAAGFITGSYAAKNVIARLQKKF